MVGIQRVERRARHYLLHATTVGHILDGTWCGVGHRSTVGHRSAVGHWCGHWCGVSYGCPDRTDGPDGTDGLLSLDNLDCWCGVGHRCDELALLYDCLWCGICHWCGRGICCWRRKLFLVVVELVHV